LEVTSKKGLHDFCGRNIIGKSRIKLFGQVWGNSGKNPSHPKTLPASTSMHWNIQLSNTDNWIFIAFVVHFVVLLYNRSFWFAVYNVFALFPKGIAYTAPAESYFASHADSISHSSLNKWFPNLFKPLPKSR